MGNGIQCKNVSKLTEREIEDEVKRAEAFQPPVRRYYVVTSLDVHGPLQQACRLMSGSRVAGGLFPVDILCWQDLELEVASHDGLFKKYFDKFGPGLDEELKRYRAEAITAHGTLLLSGFKTKLRVPIDLEELYVPLKATSDLRGDGEAGFADAKHAKEELEREGRGQETSLLDAFRRAAEVKRLERDFPAELLEIDAEEYKEMIGPRGFIGPVK